MLLVPLLLAALAPTTATAADPAQDEPPPLDLTLDEPSLVPS